MLSPRALEGRSDPVLLRTFIELRRAVMSLELNGYFPLSALGVPNPRRELLFAGSAFSTRHLESL